LRIAVFVGKFIPASETFILRQITKLIERGVDVGILALAPAEPNTLLNGAQQLGLAEKVNYLGPPRGAVRRVLALLSLTAAVGLRDPLVLMRILGSVFHRRVPLSLHLLYAALRLIRDGSGQYEIVHCQFGSLGPLAARLRRLGALSGKLVTSFRGYDAAAHLQRHAEDYEELFDDGELFCPVSQSLKSLIVRAGCREERIVVVPSGVDCSRFLYRPRYPNRDEPTRLLSVARLVEKKGVAYAIQAVARLVSEGRRLSYIIAGDGPLRHDLERLAGELRLEGIVRVLGWVDEAETARLLAEAHIFVAPSITATDGDQEGIPNVLKEAMAVGLPVVSTWHSGIPELVEDGVSGFLVAERDVGALANRLAYLIDHPELWPAMGHAGRKRVEQEFDVERITDRLITLYRRLLDGGVPISTEARGLMAAH
jgi:colanic acid/amylovoran biosynthesis glycosyltransferase